jgi:uncharacterized coiled-coil protein SlyX
MRLDGKKPNAPSCLVVNLSEIEAQLGSHDEAINTLQSQVVELATVLSALNSSLKELMTTAAPPPKKAAPAKKPEAPAPKPVAKAAPARKRAGSKRKK